MIQVQKYVEREPLDIGSWVTFHRCTDFLSAMKMIKARDVYSRATEEDYYNYEQMGMVLDRFQARFYDLVTLQTSEGGLMIRLDRGHNTSMGRFSMNFFHNYIYVNVHAYMEVRVDGPFERMPIREIVGAIEGIHGH